MKGQKLNQMICTLGDEAQVSALADHASVACKRCGAKAHAPANLCDPVQISSTGKLGG